MTLSACPSVIFLLSGQTGARMWSDLGHSALPVPVTQPPSRSLLVECYKLHCVSIKFTLFIFVITFLTISQFTSYLAES